MTVIEGLISRSVNNVCNRSNSCIPASSLPGFQNAFNRLKSLIQIDNNSNNIPDICEQ